MNQESRIGVKLPGIEGLPEHVIDELKQLGLSEIVLLDEGMIWFSPPSGVDDALGFCVAALKTIGYEPVEICFTQTALPVYPMSSDGKMVVPDGGTEWISGEEAVRRGLATQAQVDAMEQDAKQRPATPRKIIRTR